MWINTNINYYYTCCLYGAVCNGNLNFFGPKCHALRYFHFRAHPFNAPPNDVARLKTIKYKHHINIRYIRILCT